MGHRLSKIYTRTGDQGTTGLGDGSRVKKDDARIEAIGAVDELNAAIGLLATEEIPEDIQTLLVDIQHTLFDLGGELSIPGHNMVLEQQVTYLEENLDALNEQLPPLKEFILPGGCKAAATCHLARSICRRAERRLFSLANSSQVSSTSSQYINRLSDLLFVMARHLNKHNNTAEALWRHDRT